MPKREMKTEKTTCACEKKWKQTKKIRNQFGLHNNTTTSTLCDNRCEKREHEMIADCRIGQFFFFNSCLYESAGLKPTDLETTNEIYILCWCFFSLRICLSLLFLFSLSLSPTLSMQDIHFQVCVFFFCLLSNWKWVCVSNVCSMTIDGTPNTFSCMQALTTIWM